MVDHNPTFETDEQSENFSGKIGHISGKFPSFSNGYFSAKNWGKKGLVYVFVSCSTQSKITLICVAYRKVKITFHSSKIKYIFQPQLPLLAKI